MTIKENENGTRTFRIRENDKCSKYECKGNRLTLHGVCEKEEKMYKVVARCDKCGTLYAYSRINRRLIER